MSGQTCHVVCFCFCLFTGHKIAIEYDFDSVTIRALIGLLSNYQTSRKENVNQLSFEFGNSLKLLPLQDILLLLKVCQNKFLITDIEDAIDWNDAVKMSKKLGIDVTSTHFARDASGSPYLSNVVKLGLPNELNIIPKLFKEDFDINLHDIGTGETLVFELLKNYDKYALLYMFDTTKYEKQLKIFVNYYNKNGNSALALALTLYKKEKIRKKEMKNSQSKLISSSKLAKSILLKDQKKTSLHDATGALLATIAQKNAAKQQLKLQSAGDKLSILSVCVIFVFLFLLV